MAKIIYLVITCIHGLIHLMGFVKAFSLAEIKELTLPISKPMGILWFVACILFLSSGIQYTVNCPYWWLTAGCGIVISLALVINFWHDAKFGVIPNIVLLIITLIGIASFRFEKSVTNEAQVMRLQIRQQPSAIVTPEMMRPLPGIVQRWLMTSGIVGKEQTRSAHLQQKMLMKMKPEQEDWTKAVAEQHVTIDPPAFIWKVTMNMLPFVNLTGRDSFVQGKGAMLIKLLSLIPIVDSHDNPKIDTGSLQRFLGEIVWYPSAALSSFITWEEIDALSAKATMSYGGTIGSGVFHFTESGDFVRFTALRYMGSDETAKLREWIISATESRVVNGVKVPVKLEATWKLDEKEWTWLQLEITDIEYQ